MDVKDKGFVKSLEAIVSAALVLIFVLGIFPNINHTPKNNTASFQLLNFLKSSDGSAYRNELLKENMSFFENDLNREFRNLKIKVGILKLVSTSGFFISSPATVSFKLNKTVSEKEVLFVWAKNCSNLSININDVPIYFNQNFSSNFSLELDLTKYTKNDLNNLSFKGTFEKLNYIVDFYYYYTQPIEKNTIRGLAYYISGNYTNLLPRALILLR